MRKYNSMKKKLNKTYASLLDAMGRHKISPNRLVINKAKWLHNMDSPLVLMIDDLTNAWCDTKFRWEDGGDWGGQRDKPGSAVHFLENVVLEGHPEIKVTFFTVTGRMNSFVNSADFTYAAPLNATPQSIDFFRSLHADKRFEISYHGLNHGIPKEKTPDFIQEWQSFDNIETACLQIVEGVGIYRHVFGALPEGGKYGGWSYNTFGDASINNAGFKWWCRDWMPRDTRGDVADDYYECQTFGENSVVAIPATLHGFYWQKKQVDLLLEKKQVLSVEEHIARHRPDGLIQTPNIYDDYEQLRKLFSYLKGKKIWHATCSEIASYHTAYAFSAITDIGRDNFTLRYNGKLKEPLLTVTIDCSVICSSTQPYVRITLPDGRVLAGQQYRWDTNRYKHEVTLPVLEGSYHLEPVDKPVDILLAALREGAVCFNQPFSCGGVVIPGSTPGLLYALYEDGQWIDWAKLSNDGEIEFWCSNSGRRYVVK